MPALVALLASALFATRRE
ncbi:hypothetical protein [Natrinema sp. 74]